MRASYTTVNSRLRHNWITAIERVGDELVRRHLRGGRAAPRAEWRVACIPRSARCDRDQSERHAGDADRGSTPARWTGGLAIFDRASRALATSSTDGLPSLNVTALAAGGGTIYIGHRQRAGADRGAEPSMRRGLLFLLLAWAGPRAACADAGVLVPAGHTQPDAKIFSLDEMTIEIRIDNGDARVAIRQIFGSHTAAVTEGSYSFALPGRAAVSDFAVWDDVTRIPGVILERRRAEEIYESAKQQAIDPGLLQQGERGAGRSAPQQQCSRAQSCRSRHTAPSASRWSTTRRIPVENLRSSLAIPLRPDAYQALSAGSLRITLDLSSTPERDLGLQAVAKTYPAAHRASARRTSCAPSSKDATWRSPRISPIEWSLDPAAAGEHARVIAQRDPSRADGVLPGFGAAGQGATPRQGAAQRRGPVRYLALHAVGEAGAQLSRARRRCCTRCARRTASTCCCSIRRCTAFAPAPGRRHAGAGREGAGIRESERACAAARISRRRSPRALAQAAQRRSASPTWC